MSKQTNKNYHAIFGPKAYCCFCGKSKVLSPCHTCQSSNKRRRLYCRGCGKRNNECEALNQICITLGMEELSRQMKKICAKKSTKGFFEKIRLRELPASIGELTWLESFGFDHSVLETLPPEIGNLTNLTFLCVSSNRLSELPPEIGNLVNIDTLIVSCNRLLELPPEIGKIKKLRCLYISHNELDYLPKEIEQLKNLEAMQLQNNKLSKTFIRELKKKLPGVRIKS